MTMNNRLYFHIVMQGLNILFSLAGILVKFASTAWQEVGLLNERTIMYILGYLMLMIIYAFFWQKIMKKIPLSTAYLNKGLIVFWSLLWAAVVFDESITVMNILGTAIIFSGTILVNDNE